MIAQKSTYLLFVYVSINLLSVYSFKIDCRRESVINNVSPQDIYSSPHNGIISRPEVLKKIGNLKSSWSLALSSIPTALVVCLPLLPAMAEAIPLTDPVLSVYKSSYNIWRYFLAGGVCCAVSHGVAVPLDVIKTKIQVAPEIYGPNLGIIGITKKIIQDEGILTLSKGIGPTLVGYTLQGSLKYGFYEVFKPLFAPFVFDMGIDLDQPLGKLLIFSLAGAFADVIGSTVLSPFESARIRLIASPSFASGLFQGMSKVLREEGLVSLFVGLPPILIRQVPYTTVQLATFEFLTSQMYSYLARTGNESRI